MDLVGTGTIASLDHVERCPDADPPLCATDPFPAHLHDQALYWARSTLGVAGGLGQGWQLGGTVGLDLKVTTIDYTTLSGEPYDPPYGNIHHRDETLFGLADGTLVARRDLRSGPVNLGLSVGSTIPLGRTEQDPFALTEAGVRHQHFQRGTGVFAPLASADVAVGRGPVTATAWVDTRAALYANGKGYQPGAYVGGGAGPVWAVVRGLRLVPAVEVGRTGVDRWSGEVAPGSGTVTLGGSVAALATVSPAVRLLAQGRSTVWQRFLQDEGDQVTQRLVVSLGASVTPPAR
jgi:hypothetical protein